jgi:CheY-like chemotaxis protein
VLLVEDNDINQLVAVGLLTRLGYRTAVAGDGVEALEMTTATSYDAILMDCRMPRMDGFTATAELRQREQHDGAARTPIIAMTASALIADRERCLAAGMDDYLAKPVIPGQLADTMRRWIPDSVVRRLQEIAGDRTPEDIDLVRSLVSSFLRRAPEQVTALCAACDAGDAEAVEDQAHSLKGAAGTLGATAVMQACDRLESDARDGAMPDAVVDVRTLRRELDQIQTRLRDVLSEHYSPAKI